MLAQSASRTAALRSNSSLGCSTSYLASSWTSAGYNKQPANPLACQSNTVPTKSTHALAHWSKRSGRKSTPIARTSADWWEDEEEFDPITETILPKDLHLFVLGESTDALKGIKFTTAFSSEQSKLHAAELWDGLGQGGPPFFKKIRTRRQLDYLEDASTPESDSSLHAVDFLSEIFMQSWRMELDYGLAGADLQPKDQLLVACNSLAASRLIRAVQEATGQGVGGASTTAREAVRGYTLIQTKGFNLDGQETESLKQWSMLSPSIASGSPAAL